jgi:hypothetical protein
MEKSNYSLGGIVLNMVLGMTLFFVSNTALPYYYFEGESIITEASPAYEAGLRSGDRLGYVNFIYQDSQTLIIDSEVIFKESTYVLGFLPNKVRDNPKLEDASNCICLTMIKLPRRPLVSMKDTSLFSKKAKSPTFPISAKDILQMTLSSTIRYREYFDIHAR